MPITQQNRHTIANQVDHTLVQMNRKKQLICTQQWIIFILLGDWL